MDRARNYAPAAAAVTLITLLSLHAAHAAQPPLRGCRPASKLEYQSAKRQYLLHTRVGEYVRTGRFWRRSYWYCRH
ncbi:MAG: hypothetical protein WB868_09570 [Xanthobacteraceae bacterium]